jgi:predicted unusual protein kinase regulating ubiquinone biosynthesis (AarF/ABC1/UbiB family)
LNKDTIRILSLVEDSKGAQAIVKSTSLGVTEELQLKREMMNYEIAKLLYHDPNMELTIPSVIKELPSSDRMFVMSLAQGKNVSKMNLAELSDESLKTMQKAYFDSLERWFERSMSMDTKLGNTKILEYKTKIREIHASYYPNEILSEEKLDKLIYQFNGDLHGGNVFLDLSKDYKHGYLMTWIDWGNAHALTIDQKRGQIELILGAISRNPKQMLRAMNAITPLTEAQKTSYLEKASAFLKNEAVPNNMDVDMIANRALSIALDLGVDVPESAVNWGRGKGMLETSLKEITTEMERRGLATGKEIKAFSPARAYMQVLKKYLVNNIPAQLISAEIRSKTIIPLKTLGSFIVKQSQYFLSHACNLRFMSPF